jgi:hypothetical protein
VREEDWVKTGAEVWREEWWKGGAEVNGEDWRRARTIIWRKERLNWGVKMEEGASPVVWAEV